MPRPKLPSNQKRSVVVYVLLRSDEAAKLDLVRGRKPRGTEVRDRLLTTLKRPKTT